MLDDTQRLMGTVEQVLRAARVTQKNALLNRAEVEIGPLVQEAVELARSRHHLSAAGTRLGAGRTTSERLVTIGDREELSTALSNMLDNAVKYSPGDPKIRVEVVTPDLEHVRICVKDSGVGIARGELKRIFKRFYRVVATPAHQVKGSGLGLFIVRSIARRHGGKAYAESEGAGKGTTVTIELAKAPQ